MKYDTEEDKGRGKNEIKNRNRMFMIASQ